MLKSYGFIRYDVFVIPSNIQVSAKTPEGELITQIRHIESFENDFDRLDHLNDLSRYVCAHKPDADHLKAKFDKVISLPEQPEILRYVAGVMGGAGFAVFFGSGFADASAAIRYPYYQIVSVKVKPDPAAAPSSNSNMTLQARPLAISK